MGDWEGRGRGAGWGRRVEPPTSRSEAATREREPRGGRGLVRELVGGVEEEPVETMGGLVA